MIIRYVDIKIYFFFFSLVKIMYMTVDNVLDNQHHKLLVSLSLPLARQPSAASSTFHQARPLILHPAGGPFTMQPNVLIMCPAWSHCWWLADYHLIKRHGQAGERRTCHSLRSSSEHRNNTCWRHADDTENDFFIRGKWQGRSYTV